MSTKMKAMIARGDEQEREKLIEAAKKDNRSLSRYLVIAGLEKAKKQKETA